MANSKKTIHQMSDEKKKPGQGETLKKVFRYLVNTGFSLYFLYYLRRFRWR